MPIQKVELQSRAEAGEEHVVAAHWVRLQLLQCANGQGRGIGQHQGAKGGVGWGQP